MPLRIGDGQRLRNNGGPRRRVDVQAKNIRAVVVADGVHMAACGEDIAEVEVGDQRFLAFTDRPGDDLATGADDCRVARFEPVAVGLTVFGGASNSRSGKPAGIWSACNTGLIPTTNMRFSRAMGWSVAIQRSPVASVGASQMSTPCAYR